MRSPLVVLLCAGALPAQVSPDPLPKMDVKVLYAGVPGPRTEAWRAFLAPRTAGFEAIATEQVTVDAAKGFDVVVVDCPDPTVRDDKGDVTGLKVPKAPGIDKDFARPVVFVGAMVMIPHRLEWKLGWL